MASKVFVGNLNFNTSREEVETLFSQVGKPRDVFMPNDRETGRPRGFAFVEFETDDEANNAIEKFNGYELGGRALRVNRAEERPRGAGGGGGFGGGGRGGGGYAVVVAAASAAAVASVVAAATSVAAAAGAATASVAVAAAERTREAAGTSGPRSAGCKPRVYPDERSEEGSMVAPRMAVVLCGASGAAPRV